MRCSEPGMTSRFAIHASREPAWVVRQHERLGSRKAHKQKKNAKALHDSANEKPPITMSLHHNNLTAEQKRTRRKYWVDIFAGIATVGVFGFSVYSWHRQEAATHIDMRAWLSANEFALATNTYSAQQSIVLVVVPRNSGKTPAFIDTITYSIGISTRTNSNIDWISTNSSWGISVPPGGSITIPMIEKHPLGDAAFTSLENGDIIHHFRGSIHYHDVFEDAHETTFLVPVSGTVEQMVGLIKPEEPGIMN